MPDERYSDEGPPRRDDDYERGREERRYNDYDDDLDVSRRSRRDRGWLDQQFGDTSMVLLVVFALCCGIIAFGFGLAGVVGCKDPNAKQKALVTMIVSGIMVAISVFARFASVAAHMR
jgi:hypothetical protein